MSDIKVFLKLNKEEFEDLVHCLSQSMIAAKCEAEYHNKNKALSDTLTEYAILRGLLLERVLSCKTAG